MNVEKINDVPFGLILLKKPLYPEMTNVAVYHGEVNDPRLDTGFVMKGSLNMEKVFGFYDYLFLGHIHKRQQVDEDGRAWYCGNTIQKDFGETQEKGFMVWEIEDKNKFSNKPA